MSFVADWARAEGLFVRDADGVVRLPHLVRGRIVAPPRLPFDVVRRALGDRDQAELDGAHVVRTRNGLHVLPRVDPAELVVAADELVALGRAPFADALALLGRVERVLAEVEPTLAAAFRPEPLAAAVDRELSFDGVAGRVLLDGWVATSAPAAAGLLARADAHLFGGNTAVGAARALRAWPTRQLHLAAGNVSTVAALTAARALALKSALTLKLSRDALLAGALVGAALHAAGGGSPLVRSASVVYWRGGDERLESSLLAPEHVDRVVVWGGAEAIRSVTARAGGVKVVAFRPHQGVSLIGREAQRDVAAAARLGAIDALVGEQASCDASLVHFVEGDERDAARYAEALAAVLARWDAAAPRALGEAERGRLRRLRRGKLLAARWWQNDVSAVVVTPRPLDAADHPQTRLVVVCPVASLDDAAAQLDGSAGVVGVYPEARRHALRDLLAARGVAAVVALGEAERAGDGVVRDGMRALAELVSWTTS